MGTKRAKKTTAADIELRECGMAARGEYALPPFEETDPRRAFGYSSITDVIELRRRYDVTLRSRSDMTKTLHETQDVLSALKKQYDELVKKNVENIRECNALRDDRAELEGQVRNLIEACGALGRSYTAVT